ncbi:MAG: replicative DNA helicase [Steroidobacteraceae bacterium]
MAAEILNLPLPPHSVEAEQSVLGSLLMDGTKVWPLVAPILKAEDFYRADHRLIFSTIAELQGGDAVTVNARLERQKRSEEAGGFAYLSRLMRETSSAANAEQYARVVRERAQLRGLAEIGRRLEEGATEHGSSAEQLAADLARQLTRLRGRQDGTGLVCAGDLAKALIDDLDARREGPCGLQTGLADFDLLTGGLEPGELTIIAGRPGTGKTSLLVTMAGHVSRNDPVAVFSAEMPALQLARRCTALFGSISQTKLRQPKKLTDDDWVRVSDGVSRFGERKLWIDDRQLPPIEHIRAECIGHKARHGLSLVMIDYCQLVAGHGANRYEQLREVAYGAKALAKELSCPVVMLAQINRGVESREDRRPRLSDLRDSGSIEEAADIVGLLYCEGYYNQDFDMPNVLECAIEKHRNGERGQCLWHFAGEFSRMTALEDTSRSSYRLALRSKRKGSPNDL